MPTYDIFNLSLHNEHTAKIIESIPKNWSHITGTLYAPTELHNTGKIAQNTRLKLSCNFLFSPLIIASLDQAFEDQPPNQKKTECYEEPDLIGILHEHTLPSSIEYIEAGRNPLSFNLARNILLPYIVQGYKGKIEFICGDELPRAKLDINHYTKTLELILYPENRGQERLIDPIYRTIREVKLKERTTRVIEFPNKKIQTE